MLIPKEAWALRRMAARDPSRYQLTGIRFHRPPAGPDGHLWAEAIATDGKVLASYRWLEDDPMEFPAIQGRPAPTPRAPWAGATIPNADCDAAEKSPAYSAKHYKPILKNLYLEEEVKDGMTGLSSTTLDTTQTAMLRPIDGTYPDIRDLDDFKPRARVRVNVELLARAVDVAKRICPGSSKQDVFLEFDENPGKPIRLRAEEGDRAMTLWVMPLVLEEDEKKAQEFSSAPPDAGAVARPATAADAMPVELVHRLLGRIRSRLVETNSCDDMVLLIDRVTEEVPHAA